MRHKPKEKKFNQNLEKYAEKTALTFTPSASFAAASLNLRLASSSKSPNKLSTAEATPLQADLLEKEKQC
jgi:hypothetical protein